MPKINDVNLCVCSGRRTDGCSDSGPRVTFWQPTFWPVCAYTVMVDHFLAAEALARFNLSISSRSEAEHLDRTAPISESFLRSIAASAAPSRSLAEEEGWLPRRPETWGLTCLITSQRQLPDGQVSSDLLLRRYLGNILLSFVLVVILHANLDKSLKRSKELWEVNRRQSVHLSSAGKQQCSVLTR